MYGVAQRKEEKQEEKFREEDERQGAKEKKRERGMREGEKVEAAAALGFTRHVTLMKIAEDELQEGWKGGWLEYTGVELEYQRHVRSLYIRYTNTPSRQAVRI